MKQYLLFTSSKHISYSIWQSQHYFTLINNKLVFPSQTHTHNIYIVRMIQLGNKLPTAKYFIIRPHIGVKWSFDVRGRTTPPGNVICDRGAHLCYCLFARCRLSNVTVCWRTLECFSSGFCSEDWLKGVEFKKFT